MWGGIGRDATGLHSEPPVSGLGSGNSLFRVPSPLAAQPLPWAAPGAWASMGQRASAPGVLRAPYPPLRIMAAPASFWRLPYIKPPGLPHIGHISQPHPPGKWPDKSS